MAEKTIPDLVKQNAQTIPSANAITYRENGSWRSLTWETFWKEIAKTANGLKTLGLKENDCACIYSQNSKDWIIFDLAVQIAGGVSVPVYATNTSEQTQFIIEQTGADFILCGVAAQTEIAIQLRNSIQKPVHIFTSHKNEEEENNMYQLDEWNKQFSDIIQIPPIAPEKTATIIYTSGTTGIPKRCSVDEW